jgi:hypothetical protein
MGCGVVVVEKMELKVGDTDADADLVQPKEGPTGPHIEHLKGVGKDDLRDLTSNTSRV